MWRYNPWCCDENVIRSYVMKFDDSEVRVIVPAGKYIVGDPCYCVHEDDE